VVKSIWNNPLALIVVVCISTLLACHYIDKLLGGQWSREDEKIHVIDKERIIVN
jgi:hypothetical protein